MPYSGFDALVDRLKGQRGVADPKALAASIGKKKYGVKKFKSFAKRGKKMRGVKPVKIKAV